MDQSKNFQMREGFTKRVALQTTGFAVVMAACLRPIGSPNPAGLPLTSACVDMQRVEPGLELPLQSCVDRPMAGQTREPRERRRPDLDRIMGLSARRCASVAVVKMGFIYYIELSGREGGSQGGTNTLAAACQFLRH